MRHVRKTCNRAPRAIRNILKCTRNRSRKANTKQSTTKENASSQGQIYGKHLQAREHFKHETRHTKEKSIFSIVRRRRRLNNHFSTKLPSSIKAPSWKAKQSYILTSSQTPILREDSKTVISTDKFLADHNKLLTS